MGLATDNLSTLEASLDQVKGIGPNVLRRLEHLGLTTIWNLIRHFPFRYEDYSKITKIQEATPGQQITLKGEIWSIANTYTRFRKILTKAILNDGSGSVELVWFNQSWLTKNISPGDTLQVSGKVDKRGNKLTFTSPEWEKVAPIQDQTLHTGRIVPVYPETMGLTSKWFRQKMAFLLPQILPQITDPLPDNYRKELLPLAQALHSIHFPKNFQDVSKARARLAFDELFEIQLATLKIRQEWHQQTKAIAWTVDLKKLTEFINFFPFKLTNGQNKVIQEIIHDVSQNQAMNRLLQGEVGSGKTVVCATAIYLGILNNVNSLLMAPTEILAIQHFNTLTKLLSPFGVKVAIYTGSKKFTKEKASPSNILPHVIVGTHALLSDKLIKDNIGLVVVDEQQRFGVEQRSLLRSNRANNLFPHFLTMTATPIPRTVALTFYGDLDISTIGELPKGRKRVRTHVVPSFKRADAYNFIAKKVNLGDQVYIVTPLIEQSETLISAKAAKVEFERLQTQVFPNLRLGLLHGRLKPKEKAQAIERFRNRELDILISTSVVEVGVDIPNATIMVIEGAERFGLAQLHQLRGRVGRGEKESYCLLFTEMEESTSVNRLKNLEKIHDGLELSEIDLKIRGSGQIFGTIQSGRFDLKIARLSDLRLVETTRETAKAMLRSDPNLDKHPYYKGKLANLSSGVMPD